MFNKIKKQKRGFSLVELMVVVAIMGTLSAIAIPAYNDYRRSAKKTAYRSDLSGLHKGWLAFGVENDDFCERETTPANASIRNVGMSALTTSKLYGDDNTATPASCSDSSYSTETTCVAASETWTAAIPAGNGPGKVNFIGFETINANCPGVPVANARITDAGAGASAGVTGEADCDLNITSYEMGVVGHISGETWFGQSINNLGVLSVEDQDTSALVDPQCA